jgi:hypothetical protein
MLPVTSRSVDRKFYVDEENIYYIGPQSPKMEYGAQNKYDRVTCPSNRNFTGKNILLEVKKVKASLQSPK